MLQVGMILLPALMWFVPPPSGLPVAAWRLFAIFGAAILSGIVNAFPILTASAFAIAAAPATVGGSPMPITPRLSCSGVISR